MKEQPIGICDYCLEYIMAEDWYTSKGKPRQHCCRDCRNTANSQAGAQIRSTKTLARIAAGEWINPATLHPPDPVNVGIGVRRSILGRIRQGVWTNPALSQAARKKLSRPRKHSGPLAVAIDRLDSGSKISDLSEDEATAYRTWRKERYSILKSTQSEEDKAQRRAQWRAYWHRRRQPHVGETGE